MIRGEELVSTPQPPHNCQCQYLVVFADKGGGWSCAVDARDLLTQTLVREGGRDREAVK